MPNEPNVGEKRKQTKSDTKRISKRTKTGGVASTSNADDHDNLSTDTVPDSEDIKEVINVSTPSNTTKPLSSSSSQTIDDAVEDDSTATMDKTPGQSPDVSSNKPDTQNAIDESAIRPTDPHETGYTVKGERITFKLPNVTLLERVSERGTRFKGVRDLDYLPFCRLADYLNTNKTKTLRLLRYCTEAVGKNMTSIFNTNPADFARVTLGNLSKSRRVVSNAAIGISDKLKLDSTFFIVGRVVHSSLLGETDDLYSRELSVQPIHRFAPRSIAVMAELLDFRRPVFPLRDDGLQFTTTRKPFEDGQKAPNIRHNPMNGVTHGPSPRPWNEKVPLFDGRSQFQLSNYATMEKMKHELEVGDFALVAFTLGGWRNTHVAPNDPRAERVSLNIQFAVLLERPVDNDQRGVSERLTDGLKDETPLGVKDTATMKDILPNELTDAEVAMQIHSLSSNYEGPAM